MQKDSSSATVAEINLPLLKARAQKLTELLQQQLELAKQGRIEEVEILVSQSDPVVKHLCESQILESDELQSEKRKLEKLYKQIYLSLADRHKNISNELQSIRKSKRTLQAYRGSV